MNQKVAILGASRGLGKALSDLLKEKKIKSLLVSRKKPENMNPDLSQYVRCDLTEESELEKLKNHLIHKEVSMIFYLAGGGPYGFFHKKDFKDHNWAFHLNFLSPVKLIHELLKLKKDSFKFIYIGSLICEKELDEKGISYTVSKKAFSYFHRQIIKEKNPLMDLRLFHPSYMDTDLLPQSSKPRLNNEKILCPKKLASVLWEFSLKKQEENKVFYSDH